MTSFAVRGIIDLSAVHFVVFDEFYGKKTLKEAPHYSELTKTFFNLAHVSPSRIIRPNPTMAIDQAESSFSELVKVRPPNLLILGLGPLGNIGWIFSASPKQDIHNLSIEQATAEENQGMFNC